MAGIALCLISVASCSDIVGPPTLGVYALKEVEGGGLPVSWQPTEAYLLTLLADTLVFSSERRFQRTRTILKTDLVAGITADVTEEWEGSCCVARPVAV